MTDDHGGSGWNEWAKKVLADIERLDGVNRNLAEKIDLSNQKLMAEITLLKVEIAVLKTKAAVIASAWAIGVSVAIMLIGKYL